jgi:hypothetical protein
MDFGFQLVNTAKRKIIPKIPKTTLKDIRTKLENAVEPPSLVFMGQDSPDKSRGCKAVLEPLRAYPKKLGAWPIFSFTSPGIISINESFEPGLTRQGCLWHSQKTGGLGK